MLMLAIFAPMPEIFQKVPTLAGGKFRKKNTSASLLYSMNRYDYTIPSA